MANNQSWEFYQQPDTGTKYPLDWVAGLSSPVSLGQDAFPANRLILIPFNQMRTATLAKIGIDLKVRGGANAKVRLGIYANNSSKDNYPKTLVVDAGELDVNNPPSTGCNFLTLNPTVDLTSNNRYWAALFSNDATYQIARLEPSTLSFWGGLAVTGSSAQAVSKVSVAKAYGALPNPAPVSGSGDLTDTGVAPAIILGFSNVI